MSFLEHNCSYQAVFVIVLSVRKKRLVRLLSCILSSVLPQGIMLVYDITNEKSFDNIKNWIRNIEEVKYLKHLYCVHVSVSVHVKDSLVFTYSSVHKF